MDIKEFFLYFGQIILLTLGVLVVCGLLVHALATIFSKLLGRGSGVVFDVTASIGTPIHELGHAIMCLLFGHKITDMKLWSPRAENGLYGYVEHSYNRRNLWARLGNLFIGMGPLFSGLGVIVLMLWLCFPVAWDNYLSSSRELLLLDAPVKDLILNAFTILGDMFTIDFVNNWIVALLGLIVILMVSLHVKMSGLDIKGSLSALPVYALLAAVFALVTYLIGFDATITEGLEFFNLIMLSLFVLVIIFAAFWVLIALIVRIISAILNR